MHALVVGEWAGFAEEQTTGPSTFAGRNSYIPAFNKYLSKQVEYTISVSIVNSNFVNQGTSNKGKFYHQNNYKMMI